MPKRIAVKLIGSVLLSLLMSTTASGQSKETFESVVKSGITRGIIKKNGYQVTYIASPAQDTAVIRAYYEDLIRKSGKPYGFSFESNAAPVSPRFDNNGTGIIKKTVPPPKTNPTITPGEQEQDESMLPATTTGTPDIPVTAGCWSKQKVFGELHFTNNTKEYTWTVPAGVTSIKIEAWSGGGDGYDSIYYFTRVAHEVTQPLFSGISGGGGGGGAYANAVITVKKGDRVMISIPPGGGGVGRSLVVKLNTDANSFFLNNAGNGNPQGMFGNGQGGTSGGTYGIFKNNLYWMGGEDGEVPIVSDYVRHDAPNGDGMLLPAGLSYDRLNIQYGRGGNAALLKNGGRGATSHGNFGMNTIGTDGKFPGGGGGGGNYNYSSTKTGKGAPGMVIIHY